MSTSKLVAGLDALKTAMESRLTTAGETTVKVYSAHPGKDADVADLEHIVLSSITGSQSPGRMGPANDEDHTIEGFILIKKPGASQTAAKSARDRVIALLAYLEAELTANSKLTNTVGFARMGKLDLQQGFDDNGNRVCIASFGIDVTSIL